MSTAVALGIGIAIITVGSLGIAGFLLWLRNRDAQLKQTDPEHPTRA